MLLIRSTKAVFMGYSAVGMLTFAQNPVQRARVLATPNNRNHLAGRERD